MSERCLYGTSFLLVGWLLVRVIVRTGLGSLGLLKGFRFKEGWNDFWALEGGGPIMFWMAISLSSILWAAFIIWAKPIGSKQMTSTLISSFNLGKYS